GYRSVFASKSCSRLSMSLIKFRLPILSSSSFAFTTVVVVTVLAKILIGDLSLGVSGVAVRVVIIVLVDGVVLSDDPLLCSLICTELRAAVNCIEVRFGEAVWEGNWRERIKVFGGV